MVESKYARLPGGATAFVVKPDRAAAQGVVLLPSMWGITPAVELMAAELAAVRGWAVCVPEIVTEDPVAAFDSATFARRRQAVASLADEATFNILREAAAVPGAGRVALIGFCVGGMYALKATSLRLFDRVVAFYGMVRVPEYWRNPHQGEPLAYLSGNTDRVLAIFGEQDEFIPLSDIDAIEAAGVPTLRYPDAGHAFAHDPAQAHYRAADAKDAWEHVVAFVSHSENGRQ
jgi:dienelactone hydrolase